MDDIRASLSRTKNKFKQRLTERKRKPDGTGANPGEGRAVPTNPLPQPEPDAIVDESHNIEGDSANAAGERASSTVRPPRSDGPESGQALGIDNRQEGGEADVDGGEASQKGLYLYPDVGVAVGGGRSGELEAVDPSPSIPSNLHDVEPGSTWTRLFLLLSLIVPSDNVDTPALPDHVPEVVRPDESLEPSAVADENKSNAKPTVSPMAELLREVRDSPGGYGLFKSVAKSLCSILDNCAVWSPSRTLVSRCLCSF